MQMRSNDTEVVYKSVIITIYNGYMILEYMYTHRIIFVYFVHLFKISTTCFADYNSKESQLDALTESYDFFT